MTERDIGKAILRQLRLLRYSTIALYLLVAVGIVHVWQDTHGTRAALCTLRHDLEQRGQSSQAFLKANPDGIPGISRAQIQSSIDNQQRTIDALAGLHCGTPKPPVAPSLTSP